MNVKAISFANALKVKLLPSGLPKQQPWLWVQVHRRRSSRPHGQRSPGGQDGDGIPRQEIQEQGNGGQGEYAIQAVMAETNVQGVTEFD